MCIISTRLYIFFSTTTITCVFEHKHEQQVWIYFITDDYTQRTLCMNRRINDYFVESIFQTEVHEPSCCEHWKKYYLTFFGWVDWRKYLKYSFLRYIVVWPSKTESDKENKSSGIIFQILFSLKVDKTSVFKKILFWVI